MHGAKGHRHLFLFEKAMLITKKKEDGSNSLICKDFIKVRFEARIGHQIATVCKSSHFLNESSLNFQQNHYIVCMIDSAQFPILLGSDVKCNYLHQITIMQ
jgi:hypothetical protein